MRNEWEEETGPEPEPEEPVTGLVEHLSQERQHPFKGVYPCKYGCGFTGTPQQLSAHYRTAHRGEDRSMGAPPNTSINVAPVVTIATDADVVRDILKALKYDKIDAYLKICDLRGYNVVSLYQAAKDIAMPFSIMKPLLSFWASYKGEPIPPPIAKELGLAPSVSSSPSSPVSFGFPAATESTPVKEVSLISEITNALLRLRELEQKSDNSALAALYERLEKQQAEIQALREELKRREIEDLRKEIEELKREVNSGKTDLQVLIKEINTRLDRLGNRAELLFMAALGYLPAEVVSQPPPEITGKVGEPKIIDLLPKELVEG